MADVKGFIWSLLIAKSTILEKIQPSSVLLGKCHLTIVIYFNTRFLSPCYIMQWEKGALTGSPNIGI